MSQQTAVDYLVEKLNQCEPFYSGIVSLTHKQHIDGLIAQAKGMEKEQINKACYDGYYKEDEKYTYEYYNETYKP